MAKKVITPLYNYQKKPVFSNPIRLQEVHVHETKVVRIYPALTEPITILSELYSNFKEFHFILLQQDGDNASLTDMLRTTNLNHKNIFIRKISKNVPINVFLSTVYDTINYDDEVLLNLTYISDLNFVVRLLSLIHFLYINEVKIKGIFIYSQESSSIVNVEPLLSDTAQWFLAISESKSAYVFKKLKKKLVELKEKHFFCSDVQCTIEELCVSLEKLFLTLSLCKANELNKNIEDFENQLNSLKNLGTQDSLPFLIHVLDTLKRTLVDLHSFENLNSEDTLQHQLTLSRTLTQRGLYLHALIILKRIIPEFIAYIWTNDSERDSFREIYNLAENFLLTLANEQYSTLKYLVAEQNAPALWRLITAYKNVLMLWNNTTISTYTVKSSDLENRILKVIEQLKEILSDDQITSILKLVRKRKTEHYPILLITPLGMSKGLLYTALKKTNPNRTLVITTNTISDETIKEVVKQTGLQIPLKIFRIQNPFTDFNSWKTLISEDWFINWVRGHDIIFNITGGTTALQYNVQKIQEFFKSSIPFIHTKAIVCIDKRPIEEQRNNPYVEGTVEEINE